VGAAVLGDPEAELPSGFQQSQMFFWLHTKLRLSKVGNPYRKNSRKENPMNKSML